MVVLTMTCSPPKLVGDLTKWLIEIDTGVYVGNLNARVRELLWKRVCENIGDGRAVMVFSNNNEQRMSFYTHNTDRKTVDFDGLVLIKKPLGKKTEATDLSSVAKPKKVKNAKHEETKKQSVFQSESYIIMDLETTGLDSNENDIIEIGMLKISDNKTADKFHCLLKIPYSLPREIVKLTGITEEEISLYGMEAKEALENCFKFIGDFSCLCYYSKFDKAFLSSACKKNGIEFPEIKFIDAYPLAKKKIKNLENYKLITVAKALGVSSGQTHRVMDDCMMLQSVICKLNENESIQL